MDLDNLRVFLFRGLMFESEAVAFQTAGIQVGSDVHREDQRLLEEAIAPFGITRRNSALEMGRLYIVLHCFENELRSLVKQTLEEHEGADWSSKLPRKVAQ